MSKPIHALAAALALTALGAHAAEAVAPGARICRDPVFALQTITAFGQASNAAGRGAIVHYTVKRGYNYDGPYDDIHEQDAPSFYFSANRNFRPQLFPGWFKVCARNNGSQTIHVDLQASGY